METNDAVPGAATALPQGDLRLLESDVAKRLLASTLPARVAYVALDGRPRVVPTWFYWTGAELVMPTFIAAPHVRHAAGRLSALRANPAVAVSIDTEGFPPEVLSIRGTAVVDEVDGVAPEYALAARRYLGEENAAAYLASLEHPSTRMARIVVRPSWVGVLDFQGRLPGALGGVTGLWREERQRRSQALPNDYPASAPRRDGACGAPGGPHAPLDDSACQMKT